MNLFDELSSSAVYFFIFCTVSLLAGAEAHRGTEGQRGTVLARHTLLKVYLSYLGK
jgi:hypothetical protein